MGISRLTLVSVAFLLMTSPVAGVVDAGPIAGGNTVASMGDSGGATQNDNGSVTSAQTSNTSGATRDDGATDTPTPDSGTADTPTPTPDEDERTDESNDGTRTTPGTPAEPVGERNASADDADIQTTGASAGATQLPMAVLEGGNGGEDPVEVWKSGRTVYVEVYGLDDEVKEKARIDIETSAEIVSTGRNSFEGSSLDWDSNELSATVKVDCCDDRFSFTLAEEPSAMQIDVFWDRDREDGSGVQRNASVVGFGPEDRQPESLPVLLEEARPPSADLQVTDSCTVPGQTTRFDASGSNDPVGSIESYEWMVDGEPVSATGPTLSESFVSFGTHEVTVIVTDDSGQTDTTSRSVFVRRSGEIGFTYSPSEPVTDQLVTFQACGSQKGAYTWDFGDGGSASGETATHEYKEPGNYTVTLNDGSTTVTRVVNVTAGGVTITSIEPQKEILPVADFPINETYNAHIETNDTEVDHVEFDLLGGRTITDYEGSDGYSWTLNFNNLTLDEPVGLKYLEVTAVGTNGSVDTKRYAIPIFSSPELGTFHDTCEAISGECNSGPYKYEKEFGSTEISRLTGVLGENEFNPYFEAKYEPETLLLVAGGGGQLSLPFPAKTMDKLEKYGVAPVEVEAYFKAGATGGVQFTPAEDYTLQADQQPLKYKFEGGGTAETEVPIPAAKVPVVGGVDVALNGTGATFAEGQIREKTIGGNLNITMDKAGVKLVGAAMPQISAVTCGARAGPEIETALQYEPPKSAITGEAKLNARAELDCPIYSRTYRQNLWSDTYNIVTTSSSPDADNVTTDREWSIQSKKGTGPGISTEDGPKTKKQPQTPVTTRLQPDGPSAAMGGTTGDRITEDALADESPALAGTAGDYTLVWDRQDGSKDVFDGHDIFVATDTGSGWSSPTHITDDDRVDADPDVATAGGDRIAVWSRADRSFTRAELESFSGPSAVLDNLELAVATDASGSWSEPELLTNDSVVDADPEVVASGETALITWTRDVDGDITTDDRRKAYAVYENGSLSPVETVDADAIDAVATDTGFRLAYAAGNSVTVGTVDKSGTLSTTDSYTVNAVESSVTSIAVGPSRTAWIAGEGINQTLQVADSTDVQTLSTQANVTGLTELTLETTSDATLLTYRGRKPGINGSTLFYRLNRGGRWVTDHGFASGAGENLTVWDATTALTSSGFRSVYTAKSYVAFDSDENPKADLFATRHSFRPDYAIDARASVQTASSGDQLSVEYTLANDGDVATDSDATVELVNASGVVATATHGPLAAGEEVTGTLTAMADESGNLTVQVDTDQTGDTTEKSTTQTAELSESNNEVTLRTGQADLRVTGVDETRQGDTLVVSTTVENVGDATAKNGRYTLETDEGTLASTGLPAVAPNTTATANVSVQMNAVEQGALTTATVTASDEADESDNTESLRLARPDVQIQEAAVRYVNTSEGVRAEIPVGNTGIGGVDTTVEIRNDTGTVGSAPVEFNGTETGSAVFETVTVSLPDSVADEQVAVQTGGDFFDADPSDNGFSAPVTPVLQPVDDTADTGSNWTASLDSRLQYSPVTAADGRVYAAGLGSNVTALDVETGEVVWRTERVGSLVDSGPALAGDSLVVGSGSGTLYALNASTGVTEWTTDLDSAISVTPAVADDTAYVGANDGTVTAVDTDAGARLWNVSVGGVVAAGPTVAGGTVYVPLQNGTVVALDAATGSQQWTRTLSGSLEGDSLAVADGTVVVTADDLTALDAVTGAVQWQAEYNDTAGASPVVANETVYAGGANGGVEARNVSTGAVEWSQSLAAGVRAPVALAGDTLYVGTTDGQVSTLDTDTGSVVEETDLGTVTPTSLTVASATVYVGTWDGEVHPVPRR